MMILIIQTIKIMENFDYKKYLAEGKLLKENKDSELARLFQQSIKASVEDGEDKLYNLTQDWDSWNVENDDKYDDLLDPLFAAVELVQDAGVPGVNDVEDDKEYRMYIKSAATHLKKFNRDVANVMQRQVTEEEELKNDYANSEEGVVNYTESMVIQKIFDIMRHHEIDPSDMLEEIGQEFGVAFEFGR